MMTVLPRELDELIERLCPSESPWDVAGEFDGYEILNGQFPNLESLKDVSEFRAELEREMEKTQSEIVKTLRMHTRSVSETKSDVDSVQETVKELEQLIRGVQVRASETERAVRDVSEEILNLERAKRNISVTAQTLKRIVMMVNSCEELVSLGGRREYDKTASLVLVVNDLGKELEDLRGVSVRVDELVKHGERVFGDLRIQLSEDFLNRLELGTAAPGGTTASVGTEAAGAAAAGTGAGAGAGQGTRTVNMKGAAETIEALGLKEEVLRQYTGKFFREYRANFGVAERGQFAPLDYAERRFQWLSKALREFTDTQASCFPEDWVMSAVLCWEFCSLTRRHFEDALAVAVAGGGGGGGGAGLLQAMSRCVELENDMQRRFEKLYQSASTRAVRTGDTRECPRFRGAMSGAFEGLVPGWIGQEERSLGEFVGAMRAVGMQGDEVMEKEDGKMVFASAVELFTRLKGSFNKVKSVTSQPQHITDIFRVFRRTLTLYSEQVLRSRLPAAKVASEQHIETVAAVIGSCEYCAATALTLQQIVARHQGSLSSSPTAAEFSFAEEEKGVLRLVLNEAVETTVACMLGAEVKEGYKEMVSLDWWSVEAVAGVSKAIPRIVSYISRCMRSIHGAVVPLGGGAPGAAAGAGGAAPGSLFRRMLSSFASRFVGVTNETLNLLKPISEIGAQQLLVDFGALRAALIDLPQTALGIKTGTCAAADSETLTGSYSETLTKGFHKLENLLKALASPAASDKAALREMIVSLDPGISEADLAVEIERVQWLSSARRTPSLSANAFTTPARANGNSQPASMGQVEQLFAAATAQAAPPPPPPQISGKQQDTATAVSQALKKGLNKFFAASHRSRDNN